jgi:hypothetical protein
LLCNIYYCVFFTCEHQLFLKKTLNWLVFNDWLKSEIEVLCFSWQATIMCTTKIVCSKQHFRKDVPPVSQSLSLEQHWNVLSLYFKGCLKCSILFINWKKKTSLTAACIKDLRTSWSNTPLISHINCYFSEMFCFESELIYTRFLNRFLKFILTFLGQIPIFSLLFPNFFLKLIPIVPACSLKATFKPVCITPYYTY